MIKLSNGHQLEYLTASGSLGFRLKGWPWERILVWLGLIKPELFTNVIKTLTRYPRTGNLRWWKPWTCVRLIPNGAVNKVGLTNKGVDWWCEEVGPKIDFEKIKVIGSIYGSQAELWYMTARLNPFPLVAMEINVSCPNSGDKLQESQMIIQAAKKIKQISRHPLILKLSINQDYLTIARGLRGVIEAISFNSVPWETLFPNKRSPLWRLQKKVGGGGGGVSGKLIQGPNWRAMKALHDQGLVPVIASSVMSYEDISKAKNYGAQAISFGTAHLPSYPVWLKPGTIFTNPCRPTAWVKRTKKILNRELAVAVVTVLSFVSAFASVVPIILPSFFAYVLGFNSFRDKRKYGITIVHVFTSIIIGELIFSAVVALFFNALIGFAAHSGVIWFILIMFAINYTFSGIFYFIGTRKAISENKSS